MEVKVRHTTKKNQPTNLAKYQYFYTRDLISFLHFEKKLALSMASVFRNIHFLQHFDYFWQWLRFLIFQINANFLINQLTKHFLHKTHYNPPIFEKNVCCPLHKFSQSCTFYHMATSFHSGWGVQYLRQIVTF